MFLRRLTEAEFKARRDAPAKEEEELGEYHIACGVKLRWKSDHGRTRTVMTTIHSTAEGSLQRDSASSVQECVIDEEAAGTRFTYIKRGSRGKPTWKLPLKASIAILGERMKIDEIEVFDVEDWG